MKLSGLATNLLVMFDSETLGVWHFAALVTAVVTLWHLNRSDPTQVNVPAVGIHRGLLGSQRATLSSIFGCAEMLRGEYLRYGQEGRTFKIPTLSRWLVVITNADMLREIKDDVTNLSFNEVFEGLFSVKHTISASLLTHPYHMKIIATKLTQKLANVLPETAEEAALAFEESMRIGTEWTSVKISPIMQQCISRTSNRIFVGAKLCRNQNYLDKMTSYAMRVMITGQVADLFPDAFKGIVVKLFLNRTQALRKIVTDLGPIFQERLKTLEDLGDQWSDRPNDAIQWIIEAAPSDSTIEDMCERILFLNFVAIQTATSAVTHTMLDLAAHPEYQNPLKEEIEAALLQFGGWNKHALAQMKKLDSVLRESLRMNGIVLASMMRKAQVPYTLPDSTYLPKGTWLVAPADAIHHSERYYDDPLTFDGFRFSRMRDRPGYESRHLAATPDETYLPFGYGQHACPGRFFAINELKVLLAYIICNYEFKTTDGRRPGNFFFGLGVIPNPSAQLLFKARADRKESLVHTSPYK